MTSRTPRGAIGNPIPARGTVPSVDELYRLAGQVVGVHEGRADGCPAHRAAFRALVDQTGRVWRDRLSPRAR